MAAAAVQALETFRDDIRIEQGQAGAGRSTTILVEVSMENDGLDLLDEARAVFQSAPEIQQCYYVTGDAYFMRALAVATMAEYAALTRRLFFGNANVKRFLSLVVMDRVKIGLSLPLHY